MLRGDRVGLGALLGPLHPRCLSAFHVRCEPGVGAVWLLLCLLLLAVGLGFGVLGAGRARLGPLQGLFAGALLAHEALGGRPHPAQLGLGLGQLGPTRVGLGLQLGDLGL